MSAWYGEYGGRFVPETLIPALDELEKAWLDARADDAFGAELRLLLRDYAGRPTNSRESVPSSATNQGSVRSVDHASASSSRAGISTSGTYRPP